MSPLQLGFLIGAFVVPWLLSIIGTRLNSRRFEKICCWTLAGALLTAEFAELGVKLFFEDTPLASKLPMQLCDWALFTTVATLIWRSPRCFEVAYFWGLAGTMQGLLTPAIGADLELWRRIGFFVIHGGIVAGIVYLILVAGLRPEPQSLLRVLFWSQFYFGAALIVNALTGQNYGFLSHRPPTHSLLDLFSDNHWLYVATINLVALTAFAILYIPWWLADRRRDAMQRSLPEAER
jgi:hypothetical integral membrane protein (TIGR02206 family)